MSDRATAVRAIELLPLGALPAARAQKVAERLSRRVQVACRVAPASPAGAPLLPGRAQGDGDALLRALESRAPDGSVLLALTEQDIGLPVFTFVFGLARAGGRACFVSTARLDPAFYGLPADEDALVGRAVRASLHELGHLAALAHCDAPECLMRFAGSVEKADLRGGAFCPRCASRLPAWLGGRAQNV